MKTLGEKTRQNTKNTKDIATSEQDIANNQIDIVDLFRKVTVIETKLDLSANDSKTNNNWIRTFILIVIGIELLNVFLNYLLFGVHN